MQVLRIVTDNGSAYLVGPSPDDPGRVRVARLSDRRIRGMLGPATFARDVPAAGLVVDGARLRLSWTDDDGLVVRTSPIEDVSTWEAPDVVSTPA